MPGRMAPSLDAHETSHDWRRLGGDSIFPVKVRMATWVAANTATTTTGVVSAPLFSVKLLAEITSHRERKCDESFKK